MLVSQPLNQGAAATCILTTESTVNPTSVEQDASAGAHLLRQSR